MRVKANSKLYFSTFFSQILDFIFPKICVACEKQYTDSESAICLECQWDLPRTNSQFETEKRLESRFWGKMEIAGAYSFLRFSKKGKVQKILHAIKYRNQTQLAQFLGRIYANEIKDENFIEEIDFLIPVPLHLKKRKQRGYNQAKEFADGLSDVLHLPVLEDIAVRKVNTISQTQTKSRFQRFLNIENAFSINNQDVITGKSLAIIDDVLTSGSTLEALGNELLNAGAKRIYVITLASAE